MSPLRLQPKAKSIAVLGLCLISAGCSGGTDNVPASASGSLTIDLSTIIRGFRDAGTVVSASVRSLWSDAQKRAADISEGAQKIKEGKEQMEKGVRGE